VAVTGAVLVAATACGALLDGVRGAALGGLAVAAGLGAALLLLGHAVRRLGGVTGDVLGALGEIAATAALVVLAVR
jgi:adenosylcobinamide-GDP ribazoletransferase